MRKRRRDWRESGVLFLIVIYAPLSSIEVLHTSPAISCDVYISANNMSTQDDVCITNKDLDSRQNGTMKVGSFRQQGSRLKHLVIPMQSTSGSSFFLTFEHCELHHLVLHLEKQSSSSVTTHSSSLPKRHLKAQYWESISLPRIPAPMSRDMADREKFQAVLPFILTDLDQDLTRRGTPKALKDRFLAVGLHACCFIRTV